MNDNAKILAEKVMGWRIQGWRIHKRNTACYCRKGQESGIMTGCVAYVDDWNPENNDSDLMMCWDKFSNDRPTELERTVFCWKARVRRGEAKWICHKDRRKAMVECMVKAVTS